ncbi:acyl-CoA dehydrogenase family protein [Undibacterium sp. JH2W]|uniref:acyl-CoA dehydrogenase family protein n=1 Tax=Undibacterium sp. JH2W TaxID=3413037 RepID=UPI003BF27E5B
MSDRIIQTACKQFSPEQVRNVAAKHAASTDQHGRLAQEVIDALISNGFARYFVPKAFAGLNASFTDLAAGLSTVATGCTSAAWCAAICAVVGRMAAYLPTASQQKIWQDGPDVVISASFRSTGKVVPSKGGWVLSGEWHFLSGIDYAEWALLCIEPVGDEQAARYAAVPASAYRILDNWDTLGMRGTGSKSIVLDDIFVPAEMSFLKKDLWAGQSAYAPGPRYQVSPIGADPQLFMACAHGAGLAALRFWGQAFQETPPVGELASVYARSAAELDAAQLLIERACQTTDIGAQPMALVARNGRDASLSADLVLSAVNRLFRLGGSNTHFAHNTLQRLWRDVQTLTSHIALRPDFNFAQYTRSNWPARDTDSMVPVANIAPAPLPAQAEIHRKFAVNEI